MRRYVIYIFAALVLSATAALAQSYCEEHLELTPEQKACYLDGSDPAGTAPAIVVAPPKPDPLRTRLLKYASVAARHRVNGLASYYSTFFDGRKTANGEIYRNKQFSAAHLTLPLGTWIEVKARKNGRKLRLRINDRGPYVSKFVLDLSQAAAKALGVDEGDRSVEMRIIALPGEKPLPEDVDPETVLAGTAGTADPAAESVAAAR